MAHPGSGDSAGVPWGGRTLPQGSFDTDDGSVDPDVQQALSALESGAGDEVEVVAALAGSRLLVPVVAVLGEEAQRQHGSADKQAEMALVTLTGADGRRALPVFTGLKSLQQWDSYARPVPVECRRAAVSAVAEGCELMVVDPAGPVTFVVSRPALWAVGQGRPWLPAHRDPDVAAVLSDAADSVEGVVRVVAEPGREADLRVVVAVAPGVDSDALHRLAAEVGERLRLSDVVRERAEAVELKLVTA